jgi:hypothetical protein
MNWTGHGRNANPQSCVGIRFPGAFMTADEYRRLAFEAQNQAARATDPIMKAGFERVAQHWLALAEQVEWMDRRFGSGQGKEEAPAVHQQQNMKPKKEPS